MRPRDKDRREALGDEIAALMGPLVRALRVALRDCAQELGLSQSEASALWALAARGESITRELAEALEIDPANASTVVTRLERRGLVKREPVPGDRRRRRISLTSKGRDARLRLARCVGERRPAFRALTTAELATFRDLLRRVYLEGPDL